MLVTVRHRVFVVAAAREIKARTERVCGAGDGDDPDVVVLGCRFDGGDDAPREFVGERILLLGAVEDQRTDVARISDV